MQKQQECSVDENGYGTYFKDLPSELLVGKLQSALIHKLSLLRKPTVPKSVR